MKQLIILLLAGVVYACTPATAQTHEFKEQVKKEFTLSKGAAQSVLAVYNLNGFIKVEGYSGDKIMVEVERSLSAKDKETLEKGKEEFKLVFEQNADSVVAYIADPFDTRPNHNRKNRDNRKIEYKFNLNFTIKVPYEMNLSVSTINQGDIHIKDVTGRLKVNNINGAIAMVNAKGTTDVHTINGNVDINYLVIPPDNSSYYTLNGNIRITYPASLSADLQFKSFNGEFFTDFPDAQALAPEVIKHTEHEGDKTVYKLDKKSAIRIGKGGKILKFETFNGNIYIKKQS